MDPHTAPPESNPESKAWRFRLPLEGRYWLAIMAFLIVVGWTKNINLMTFLGCVLLAVCGLNVLGAGKRLRRLEGRRRIDDPVFAGRSCEVVVRVRHPRRRALFGVRVEDSGPDHSLAWFAERLEGGEEEAFRGTIVLPQRGRYTWGPVTAASGYPFGLAWRQAVLVPGEEVIVLPRLGALHRGRLRRRLLHASLTRERERRRPQRHPGARDEFHSLRAYRSGDSPHAIHWRTSARRGELMVREYEDVPSDNLILVLEATPGPHREAAISLAATVCWEWCRKRGDRMLVGVNGPPVAVVDGTTGPDFARRALESMAVVENGAGDDATLLGRLATASLPPGPALLVSAGPNRLASALEAALRRRVTCVNAAEISNLDFFEPGKG
jgi:uncharacterized protein (DUF58 family)